MALNGFFFLFDSYVTGRYMVDGTQTISFTVSAVGCRAVRNLTASTFGGKEANFFGSKFAIDSSTPLSRRLLFLYLAAKSIPKTSF